MADNTHMSKRGLVAWILVTLLGLITAVHLGRSAVKGDETIAIILAIISFGLMMAFKLGLKKDMTPLGRRHLPWATIPIILLAVWAANARLFGKFDVSAVIFHIQHGLDYKGVGDDVAEFLLFFLIAAILIACISFLARRDRRVKWADRLIALPLLIVNPLSLYLYDSILRSNSDIDLQAVYTAPLITANQSSKNLLIIYLESMEATYEDPTFGNPFVDLTAIAKTGLRLNGVKQIQDTGWTIAGMTASQCGVPLLSYGLIMENRMKNIETFLPEADCLGTELLKLGYQTSYMGGADLKFAAKGQFLKTHGYQTAIGTKEIPDDQQGPLSEWGVYDDQLFKLAATELKRLSAADQPYVFTLLTLGGHSPAGYPAPICYDMIAGADDMDPLLLSIACTARLTVDFLKTSQRAGLLDNTVVVLMSDHLAMQNTQYDKLTKLDRENFVVIIDPDRPAAEVDVTASMMDMYPTILDAIGLPAKDGQAGLGVSLLRDSPTLLDTYGLKDLNHAIKSDSALRKQLWNLE